MCEFAPGLPWLGKRTTAPWAGRIVDLADPDAVLIEVDVPSEGWPSGHPGNDGPYRLSASYGLVEWDDQRHVEHHPV